MTYNPQWVDNSILDPTKFGNWVLVAEYNLSSESLDETITWDGEQNPKIRIECAGAFDVIGLQINGDTGSNYLESRMNVEANTIDGNQTTRTSIYCTGANNEEVFTITQGDFKNNGLNRNFINQTSRYISTNTDTNLQIKGLVWDNDSDDVTSIRLYSVNGSSNTGQVKVYKWQELSPVELHSLELVAEFNLSAEGLDETITWNGEQDSYIRIETEGDFDFCELRLNADGGSNYQEGRVDQDGNTPGGGQSTRTGFIFTGATGQESFSISEGYLKNTGRYRFLRCEVSRYISSNTDSVLLERASYWANNSDDVTSIRLIDTNGGAGTNTGNIKVFRRAKTSILSTAPDALHGLELSSVDASGSINVAPGSVEIKGKNIHLQTQKSVDVFTDLRSGDSVSGSQYVYAYAYDDNNTVNIEFSTTQPTKDRYGNTVIFETANFSKGLYHANDPTRRYIGQVYVKSGGSTIIEFAKCYPGYWESNWRTLATGLQTLEHGLGVLPRNRFNIHFSDDGGTSVIPHTNYYYDGSNGFGVASRRVMTNSTIQAFFSTTNVYQDNTGTWQTTGDFKLFLRA